MTVSYNHNAFLNYISEDLSNVKYHQYMPYEDWLFKILCTSKSI